MTDPTPPPTPSRVLHLDMETYLNQLDDWDHVSDEKKREFIETLWKILRQFAELGFGITSIQQAQKSGKPKENPSISAGSVLYSRQSKRTQKDVESGALPAPKTGKESPCNQPRQ